MVKKKTLWDNAPTTCPHCKGRIRVYVRNEIEVTKYSGYIVGPQKPSKKKSIPKKITTRK